MAPFRQGLDAQSLMLVAQFVPLHPVVHEQLYEFTPSVHVALFWHGLDAHSLMLVAQFVPL